MYTCCKMLMECKFDEEIKFICVHGAWLDIGVQCDLHLRESSSTYMFRTVCEDCDEARHKVSTVGVYMLSTVPRLFQGKGEVGRDKAACSGGVQHSPAVPVFFSRHL